MQDSFLSVVDIFSWYGDLQDDLVPAAGKGHWNDPDMVSGLSPQKMSFCPFFQAIKVIACSMRSVNRERREGKRSPFSFALYPINRTHGTGYESARSNYVSMQHIF